MTNYVCGFWVQLFAYFDRGTRPLPFSALFGRLALLDSDIAAVRQTRILCYEG